MLKGNDWELVLEMTDPETDDLVDPEVVTAEGLDSAAATFEVAQTRISEGRYKFVSDTEPLPIGAVEVVVRTLNPKGVARRRERIENP